MNNQEFKKVIDCLPHGFTWGSALTPDIALHIVNAALASQAQHDHIGDINKLVQSQDQQPAQEPVKGCKECDGQTYMHSPIGEYLGECPYCTKEQEPYAYDVPTEDGTELAYAIYFTKYGNPLPEGAIPLYASQQEPVKQESWISAEERLPEINVPVLTSVNDGTVRAHCRVDLGDGNWGWGIPTYGDISDFRNYECDDDYFINFWMPLPSAPEGVDK